MAETSPKSLVIIGGGIVGLCIAVVAQTRGHFVTIVARDKPEDTASGVAAGMIAPALEAMHDAAPADSCRRLSHASSLWYGPKSIWPRSVSLPMASLTSQPTVYAWSVGKGEESLAELHKTGAHVEPLSSTDLRYWSLGVEWDGVYVKGDWQLPSLWLMDHLRQHFLAQGGRYVVGDVHGLERQRIRLRQGGWITADHVVVAAGYGGHALRRQVPALSVLTPIKGHVLDMPKQDWIGVVRSSLGYVASDSTGARAGATMEPGRDDLVVDPEIVAGLKARINTMLPGLDLGSAVPRTGIRAATPDGWPLIGLDPTSGVYVATGMRRNGYVFAPLAAQIIADLVEGTSNADAEIYRPDRF